MWLRQKMESAADSQMSLQERVGGDGHLQTGGQPALHCNRRKRIMALGVALALVFSALLAATVLAVQRSECPSADLGPPACPDMCPDGWIGYRGKCYYFSEGEGDWASSQKHCSSLGASLAGIDTGQDMDFMARYKGKFDHWIGLRRDPGQPWKWANGTEFYHPFLVRGGRGDCAYLNDLGRVSAHCAPVRNTGSAPNPMCSQREKSRLRMAAHNKSILGFVLETPARDLSSTSRLIHSRRAGNGLSIPGQNTAFLVFPQTDHLHILHAHICYLFPLPVKLLKSAFPAQPQLHQGLCLREEPRRQPQLSLS